MRMMMRRRRRKRKKRTKRRKICPDLVVLYRFASN